MPTITRLKNEIGTLQEVLALRNQTIAALQAQVSKAQADIAERDARIKELAAPAQAAA